MKAGAIDVSWVEDREGLDALEGEWRSLYAASDAGPFLSWEWMTAAWSHLHPERLPRIAVAREGGAVVGLLPLSQELSGRVRIWRFAGDVAVGSDYLDALSQRGREAEVTLALWFALARRQLDFDRLELLDIARDSASLSWLGQILPGVEVEHRYRCPIIECRGTFAEYLAGRSRRDNLARRRRWFDAQAGFAIDVASEPGPCSVALESFFRLHELRWASDGGSQGISSAQVAAFHRAVVPELARQGAVRLYTLRLGPQPLASVYMLVNGRRRAFYQSGYDPAWSNRSPGLVLLARTIEDAFAEGTEVYDFLRGEEAYKREWSTAERLTASAVLAGGSMPARLYETRRRAVSGLKEAIKSVLPAEWVTEIQRRRRAGQAIGASAQRGEPR